MQSIGVPLRTAAEGRLWPPSPTRGEGKKASLRVLLPLINPSAMRPSRGHQILAGLRGAERRMRRQRDVGQFGQGMILRQRLDVEDVESGMPDLARLQALDHRLLVDQRAARGVD